MNSEFVKRLTDIVEANLDDENFGVEDLVRRMGISHINLHRKLKTLTNQTISQFIREIRLKKAKELLLNEDLTISEISYRVGFGSPTYFNKCFHEYFGYPPGEARKDGFDGTEQTNTGENHQFPEKTPDSLIQEHKLKRVNRRRNLVFASAGVIFLLLFSYIIFNVFISGPYATKSLAGTEKSVIVLPFKNLSPDIGNQYFADGIAEDILNNLYRITSLRVVSRTSAEQFRESSLSVREIARKMGANYVLDGSVRRENDKVRISVQLIDARPDQHLWSEIYDRQLTDIFTIQSDIAQKVARELQSVLSPAEKKQIEKISTTNTEAYDYYLMGRFFWNKRTNDGLKRSIEYFEKAIAADPDYAQAYAGLADAYLLQTWYVMVSQWSTGFEKAKKMAQRALELDKDLAEAYSVLGYVLCYHEWKWEESRAMFIKAIQLNPNYAMVRHDYAELLEILGEYEASRVQVNIAMELDPVSFIHRSISAEIYYRAGKFAEALMEYQRMEEIKPESNAWRYVCFQIYYRQGNDIRALETLQQIMAGDTATIKYVNKVNSIYNESGIKGLVYWIIEWGQKRAAPNSYLIARWYSFLGEKESALTWLEKAMAERIPLIPRIYSSDFEILRNEPRFMKISDQLGLTPYHKRPAK